MASRTAADGGTPAIRSCMRFACSRGPAFADATNAASASAAVTRITNESTQSGDQGISVLHSLAVLRNCGRIYRRVSRRVNVSEPRHSPETQVKVGSIRDRSICVQMLVFREYQVASLVRDAGVWLHSVVTVRLRGPG